MLSKYNEYITVDSCTYMYNYLSTAIVEIDESVINAIKTNDLSSIDPSIINTMKALHFIVDDDTDEAQEYLFHYNNYRYGETGRTLSIMFVPTYSCNLSCQYCLQGQSKATGIISMEKTNIILKFIENTIVQSQNTGVPIDTIFIHLFGGEPLLAKNQISFFCEKAKEIAQKYNCVYKCDMTTNLTLLDDDIVSLIKSHNIFTQVTIDGPQNIHDIKRVDKMGRGTYTRIINNIQKLVDNGLKDLLTIRVNIDKTSLYAIDHIMQELNPLANDIYFAFIAPFKGFNDNYTSCIETCEFANILDEKFAEVYRKYSKFVPKPFGRQSPCSLNSVNKYVIDMNLDVYKCEILICCKEMSVGKLSDNGELIINSNYYKQMQHSPEKSSKCLKCKLLPLCAGGCVGKSYIRDAQHDKNINIRCEYDQTYAALKVHLKNHILQLKTNHRSQE